MRCKASAWYHAIWQGTRTMRQFGHVLGSLSLRQRAGALSGRGNDPGGRRAAAARQRLEECGAGDGGAAGAGACDPFGSAAFVLAVRRGDWRDSSLAVVRAEEERDESGRGA